MIYITVKQTGTQKEQKISFEDLFKNINLEIPVIEHLNYTKKATFVLEETDEKYHELIARYPIMQMGTQIKNLANLYKHLLLPDMSEQYNTFYIPKRSGGLRRIDAPQTELMNALAHIKNSFEANLYAVPHNAAHAYVSQRSIVTAMKIHQKNESKWFLKLDLKDFFPTHNEEYIMYQLSKIFPFSRLIELWEDDIRILIKLALLDDRLPQGTPLSPLLTNILMMPIDYKIQAMLREQDHKFFQYTRYADDLLITDRYDFNWRRIQDEINRIIAVELAPFRINQSKTRYGSSAGKNWNLGVMLNKDNKLTIGHKQNQRFRATVFSFLNDLKNNIIWDKIDVQTLQGQISYYHSIQPEYTAHVIKTYEKKFDINFKTVMRKALQH